jgi:hypothetical protein
MDYCGGILCKNPALYNKYKEISKKLIYRDIIIMFHIYNASQSQSESH